MQRPFVAGAALLVLLLAGLSKALAADAPAGIQVPVLPATPSMNGKIDDSWAKAEKISLTMDFTYRRPAEEATEVYVGQENGFLDFAFVVKQKGSQTASQETNSSSVQGDDYVGVYLFPQGSAGIAYSFLANPHGARYQTSSENTAYTPQWTAVGHGTPDGYVVTMRIPLGIMRSAGSTNWRAQFVRDTVATNSLEVWTYSERAQGPTDPTFAGTLEGVGAGATQASSRPQPRFQIYGLSQSTSIENGGSTSRIGGDFSIPIAPTISVLGTLHPDYSNVEIDQQTIAPSTFARQYSEIRPFFTQAANYYNNHLSCSNCPVSLYTPSIPTFGQGYAIEGTQGYLSFAGFTSLGDERTDSAQSFNYTYEDPNQILQTSLQRVAVSVPGLTDVTTTFDTGYGDQRSHVFGYLNLGMDRGTNVTDPAIGNYLETGLGYATSTTTAVLNLQSIGAQYEPVDGYVAQTDVQGYEFFGNKTIDFSPSAPVHDVNANVFYARFDNRFSQLAQTDANANVGVDLKDLLGLRAFVGAQGVRVFDGEFLPFAGNGFMFGYRINTSTPTYVNYAAGRYYHGNLDAWTYLATVPLGRKLHLSLETDEDAYFSSWPGENSTKQWLERAGLDWQFNRQMSFDVGVRRIVGPNIPNAVQPLVYGAPGVCLNDPYNPGCFVNAGNVTAAFHFLTAKNEFYVVYGDANNLSTEPSLFLKWIRYIGAEKGT